MPGRSVYEAVDAYLEPLKRVTSCLPGFVQLQCYDRPQVVGAEGNWSLGEDPVDLGGGFTFKASQRFRAIDLPEEHRERQSDRYRVTTLMYSYELRRDGKLEFRLDWHPGGNSAEDRPHLHLPDHPRKHLVTSRATYEQAVEWCFEMGVAASRKGWQTVLQETGGVHLLHRSWTGQDPNTGRTARWPAGR